MFDNDSWVIEERSLPGSHGSKAVGSRESQFTLSNGRIGFRGDFEFGSPSYQRGTYINGFFDSAPIEYGEKAYGYAKKHQTMLNAPDGREIRIQIDDEPIELNRVEFESYRRVLDLKTGTVTFDFVAKTEKGVRFHYRSTRFVSASMQDLASIRVSIEFLGGSHKLSMQVLWHLDSSNFKSDKDPRIGASSSIKWVPLYKSTIQLLENSFFVSTLAAGASSGRSVSCARLTKWKSQQKVESSFAESDKLISTKLDCVLKAHEPLSVVSYFSYSQPLRSKDGERADKSAQSRLTALSLVGFDLLWEQHCQVLDEFWKTADLEIEGAGAQQQSIRFSLFQVYQNAGRDGITNLGAKGLSGEGYEGHYFWDTEVYAVPMLTYTNPSVARALIWYRYATLSQARQRAEELSFSGVLFPWRTIDGTEASAYYPAGTAQFHINADIAYAAARYALVHNDIEFLFGPVLEILVETARFWASFGDWIERSDGLTVSDLRSGNRGLAPSPRPVFCFNGVTGPDEYTAIVNNNVYTNLMASENLRLASEICSRCRIEHPRVWSSLKSKLAIGDDELSRWSDSSAGTFVPYDHRSGMFPQDDHFFLKSVWDIQNIPNSKRPLLLHYHPLYIYRFQILKQPDFVLAQSFFEHYFTEEERRDHFQYYERLTTNDSSLSYCIQAIAAFRTGETEKGWEHYLHTARMDLDDLHGNSCDGLHVAAMAGSWLTLVYGLAGFKEELRRGEVRYCFNPVLPKDITSLRFRLQIGSGMLEVVISSELIGYRLVEGSGLEIWHKGIPVLLTHFDSVRTFELREEV